MKSLLILMFVAWCSWFMAGETGKSPAARTPSAEEDRPALDSETVRRYRQWRDKLPPEHREWELKLEKNLGHFYFSEHVKAVVAELDGRKAVDWGFGYVRDDPALPRVLLIGDAISCGYTVGVRRALQGVANVHRAPENCGDSRRVKAQLDDYLDSGKWDVIVYNFGIHDAVGRTAEADYRANWLNITRRLLATGARLVWVRTTPVPDPATGQTSAAILEVNRWADELVREFPDIQICDLYTLVATTPGGLEKALRPDRPHLAGGTGRLAEKEVANSIREVLRLRYGKVQVPYLKTFQLPRPAEFRPCAPEEFRIKPERLDRLRSDVPFTAPERLKSVADYLQNTPDGRRLWGKMVERTLECLNAWNILPLQATRYVHRFGNLRRLAFVYALTGHPLLGKFIHDYTIHALTLGDGFWYGTNALRADFAASRIGTLDNSHLGQTVTYILTFAPDLFSEAERREAERQLRDDGMNACLRFLRTNNSVHNFLAVMANGAFIPAVYFGLAPERREALSRIRQFLTRSVESDGSYGEGFGYFGYPMGELYNAFVFMTAAERQEVLAGSGLKNTAEWLCYPAYYNTDPDGRKLYYRTSFGDDNFFFKIGNRELYLLAALLPSPLTVWLGKYYTISDFTKPLDWRDLLLEADRFPEAQSPETAGLPTVRAFDNGESYIRDGWKPNSTVFCLFSVHQVGARGYHQRRESHSFNFGAFGVPLVMSSGNTNIYSSTIQREQLTPSRAANTITIDDTEQKTAQKQEARVLLCRAGRLADVIVGDAVSAYTQPMKTARRLVIRLRAPECFVIADVLESAGDTHYYTSRLHLNNLEFKSTLTPETSVRWRFRHPEAAMNIELFSAEPLRVWQESGLIISPKYPIRDVLKQAGEMGNALILACRNQNKTGAMALFTVLKAYRGEEPELQCELLNPGTLRAGDWTISLSATGVTVAGRGETETFSFQ